MKILWLINIALPEASALMKKESSPFGGWLINASNDLSEKNGIDLSIAFPENGIKKYKKLKGKKIAYYPFEPVKDNEEIKIKNNEYFTDLLEEVQPDIVHIYGTEIAHTLAMVNICNKKDVKTVIAIQGLVSVISKHMFSNLPLTAIYGFTLRNLIRKDNVIGLKKIFEKRGKKEIEALKKVKHIVGRTTWDKACTSQINPSAKYHFCNETLREEFYNHTWDINKIEKYSIFLSQGQYPIKGLHYMLEAMPLILKKFPEVKVYISGKDIIKSDSLKDKLLLTYYGAYIKKMIKKYKLEKKVIFTGPLNQEKMKQRYLKSNVFICPSSIENSPNSLGEAMILGVPSIASDVGGVTDMMEHKKEGFVYQTDAPYMLAHYVCEIFENQDLALEFSRDARKKALKTHDREKNTEKLLEIYKSISGNRM